MPYFKQNALAPLYDLASALPYPVQISPHKAKLAMKIGSKYRIKEIARRHWEATARELKLPAGELVDRIISLAERLPDASSKVASSLRSEGIDHAVIGVLCDQLTVRATECRG